MAWKAEISKGSSDSKSSGRGGGSGGGSTIVPSAPECGGEGGCAAKLLKRQMKLS